MRLSEIDPAEINPGDKLSLDQGTLGRSEQKLADYIQQNCSDIIADLQATGKTLFRGVKSGGNLGNVFVGQSRQDRSPKDTAPRVSTFVDQALASNGFKALRGNSIFVTTDHNQAEGYGEVFAIFPMNGFNYTYTIQKDLIIDQYELVEYPDNLIEDATKWLAQQNTRNERMLSQYFLIQGALESIDRLKNKDIARVAKKIISNKATICESLSELTGILPDDPFVQKFKGFNYMNTANWSADAVMENLQPMKTDLQTAMKDGKEICINGKYVAVNISDNNLMLVAIRRKLGI